MQIPKHKIDSLRVKMKNFEKQGKNVVFSATFLLENQKDKLIELAPVKDVSHINKVLQHEDYEAVRIDIYDLNISGSKPASTDKINLKPNHSTQTDGLGEVERMKFEQFIQERDKEKRFAEMKEEITELEEENAGFEEKIAEYEEKVADLEQKLAAKNNFRHYAGILGEVLGRIGVNSEKINAAMGLFGIDDFTQIDPRQTAIAENTDSSGIVEKEQAEETELSPEDKRKVELIQIMADCMYSMDSKQLNLLFALFSEIEQNPSLINPLLLYISTAPIKQQKTNYEPQPITPPLNN